MGDISGLAGRQPNVDLPAAMAARPLDSQGLELIAGTMSAAGGSARQHRLH